MIKTEQVPIVWPIVAPMLARAIPYAAGRTDMRAVFENLRDSLLILWVAYDDADKTITAALTTRIAQYARRAMLVVDCAGGGQLRHWIRPASETLRAYARDAELGGLELYGRPGWARALKSCGWQQKLVVLEVSAAEPPEGS